MFFKNITVFFNFCDNTNCIIKVKVRVRVRAKARGKAKARVKARFIITFLDQDKITNFVFHTTYHPSIKQYKQSLDIILGVDFFFTVYKRTDNPSRHMRNKLIPLFFCKTILEICKVWIILGKFIDGVTKAIVNVFSSDSFHNQMPSRFLLEFIRTACIASSSVRKYPMCFFTPLIHILTLYFLLSLLYV